MRFPYALLLAGSLLLPAQEAPRRLAVLGVDVYSNEPKAEAKEAILVGIGTCFLQTRRFEVIERSQLKPIIRELKFQRDGLVDPKSMVELGRLLGVQLAILGTANLSVGLYGCDLRLDLRMVEVKTGRVQESFKVSGSGGSFDLGTAMTEALDDTWANLGEILLKRYPARGIVLKILPDGQALIDLGSREGLRKGSKLRLFQMEKVLHPQTGNLVEEVTVPMGELEVREVHEQTAVVRPKKKAVVFPGAPVERIP